MARLPVRKHYKIAARDKVLELGSRTLIMGILNVTPDSFADGGRFVSRPQAVARAWQIAEEGGDILDVGGESTRPGAEGVSTEQELARVAPVLEALRAEKYPLPISIDTSKPDVARAAIELGAVIVNDITAFGSSKMAEHVAASGAAAVLMHMRGTPRTMQQMPHSADILVELNSWAEEAVARAQKSGVCSEKIVLDPGIGFGKSVGQNLEILRNLDRLAALGFPLLVGTSRKSFIQALLKNPDGERIWGTGATVAASIVFGAHIVRVHDIAPMRDIVRIMDLLVAER